MLAVHTRRDRNRQVESAVAVSVNTAPESKVALHVAPQEIVSGFEVTLPEPVPARVAVST